MITHYNSIMKYIINRVVSIVALILVSLQPIQVQKAYTLTLGNGAEYSWKISDSHLAIIPKWGLQKLSAP